MQPTLFSGLFFCLLSPIVFLTLVPRVSSRFKADPPYYAQVYANIPVARVIVLDDVGDVLVATRDSKVHLLYDIVNSTDNSVQVVHDLLLNATELQLNHGVAYHKGYLYVSSTSIVYRWAYESGARIPLEPEDAEIIVTGMPGGGTHPTRTMIFGPDDLFYVQVGSLTDVDPDSIRAKILRFNITEIPEGGFAYENAEIFAEGTRNTVGLDFDSRGDLWGVENGANYPSRPDIEPSFELGNPAEELNRFSHAPGTHYGYPYCFTAYKSENTSVSANMQLAHPTFLDDGIHTDEWCADVANNQPPIVALPAHTAPLCVKFYNRVDVCDKGDGAFPCEMIDDMFVTFHSAEWLPNPTFFGNRVAWMPIDPETGEPTGEYNIVIYEENLEAGNCGGTCFSPVHAIFTHNGHMLISSDRAGEVYKVTYGIPPPNVEYVKKFD